MVEAETQEEENFQIAAQREEREAEHQGHTAKDAAIRPQLPSAKFEQQQNQQQSLILLRQRVECLRHKWRQQEHHNIVDINQYLRYV